MSATTTHDYALAGINAISCVALASCVRFKAKEEAALASQQRWSRLALAASIVLKVAVLYVDLNIVPSFGVTILACFSSLFFDATRHLKLKHLPSLLDALSAPTITHPLVLVSTLVDVLVTSISLTFTSWPRQALVATFACISMFCSVYILVFPSSHSATASQDSLLSVRQPLESFYRSTMSVLRDDLLDDDNQRSKVQSGEADYLQEFKAFFYDKDNLSLSLQPLLWTLRKPAIILTVFALVQAVCTCGRAVLIYCALSLLTNRASTSYAAFLQCSLSCAILYCAIALVEAKARHFTIRLTLKLRTCILSMVGEKTFRLPRSVVIETDISSLLGSELDEFLEAIRVAPVVLANLIQICWATYGLTFIVGNVAYLVLACFFAHFGFLAHAATILQSANAAFAERRKDRLMGTQPIVRSLVSIKTLGLQSYYLALLKGLRIEEKNAWRMLRDHMATIKQNLMGSYAIFNLVVMAGLAYRQAGQASNAEDIFPTLMVLCILGESIGIENRSFMAGDSFRYLQRVLDMLNMEDVPLRLEGTVEECADSPTTIRVRNLGNHHLSKCYDILLLKSVNIELFRGDFLLVWGKTGSGKTTFLNTILGEQTIKSASIHVADTSIAYCGPDTWLPDTSVQDCIIGGGDDIDEARYQAVVAACRLPAEMASLAYSNVAKIGLNGCNLSRTNRVKMILARAAYAQASIVMLDDTFATFDTTEATELAQTLLNPTDGLLRLNKATVILASHSFAVPALIDDVYCLATSQFIVYPAPNDSATTHGSDDATSPRQTIPRSTVTAPGLDASLLPVQEEKPVHARDAAQRISFQKNIVFIWKVMADRKTWPGLSLQVATIMLLELLLMLGTVAWPQFGLSAHVALFLQLVLGFLYYWRGGIVIQKITDVLSALSELSYEKVATKIMTSSPGRTLQPSASHLLDLLGNDLDTLNSSAWKLNQFSSYIVFMLLSMGILLWATSYSVTAVLGTVVCLITIQQTWVGISMRATECSDHAKQKMNEKYVEATDGLVYIRGFGWEQQMLRQLTRTINESEAASSLALSIEPWFKMALNLYWAVAFSGIVTYAFCYPDVISPNMLGVSILTLSGLPDIANHALTISMEMKKLVAATDRIRKFLATADGPQTQLIGLAKDDKNWPSIPDITFENAEIGANTPLNSTIKGAGKILSEGGCGNGKTSLLLALLGVREYKGSIRIGNIEARDLSRDVTGQIASLSPQDPIEPGTPRDSLLREFGAGSGPTSPREEVAPVDQAEATDEMTLADYGPPANEASPADHVMLAEEDVPASVSELADEAVPAELTEEEDMPVNEALPANGALSTDEALPNELASATSQTLPTNEMSHTTQASAIQSSSTLEPNDPWLQPRRPPPPRPTR